MGQSPSCMPAADPMRKRVKTGSPSSDGPQSQTMTRFSSPTRTRSSHRTSPSSFTFTTPNSPPSPLSLKSRQLTINPELSTDTPSGFSPTSTPATAASSSTSASASAARSLLSRLSVKRDASRDTRQWLATTPKGADAQRFRHFCPICYRHFTAVLTTSCCGHNICHECATAYLQAKLPNYLPLSFLPAAVMPCACPTCNQSGGVRFVKVDDAGSSGRTYVESPRTAMLVRQHEREAELEEQQQHDERERLSQFMQQSEQVQLPMTVMA